MYRWNCDEYFCPLWRGVLYWECLLSEVPLYVLFSIIIPAFNSTKLHTNIIMYKSLFGALV